MKGRLLHELRSVVGRYWRRILVAALALLLANALMICNPMLFRRAVAQFDAGGERLQAALWGIVLVAIGTLSSLFQYRMRVGFISVSRDAEADLRMTLFQRMQRQTQSFFDRYRVGDLMSRLTNDVAIYREVVGPGLMYPASFLAITLPAVIAMGVISPPMTLLALVPILVIPPLMLSIRRTVYATSTKLQEALSDMNTLVQEDYSSIRLVKSYGQEEAFSSRFAQLCRRYFSQALRLVAVESIFFPLMGLIGKLTTVGLVAMIGFIAVTTADAASFMWIQSYLLVPVLMMGWILPLYQRGRGAYDRLVRVHKEPPDVFNHDGGTLTLSSAPGLTIRDLTFTHPESVRPALDDLSMEVPSGAIVGITGPPGSGKTTLLHLLHRDYPLPAGPIQLAGEEIHRYELHGLRRSIAVVEEHPFLFSMTVAENIALARPEASPEEIERAARLAQVHDEIVAFPRGYETVVGERGITLSGGQRQRVALARALLLQAPLLLFDDIFSALDAGAAQRVLTALRTLENTTTLLVTHRIPILQQTDRVYVLQEGRLVQEGPPAELTTGPYASLVELDQYLQELP
jgi:ATP-binding cassette, subfamily B, multidrug efflux pump